MPRRAGARLFPLPAAGRHGFDRPFEGDTDLAVVEATPHHPPVSDACFDQRSLLDDPYGPAVREGHRPEGRDLTGLAGAAREPWAGPPPESSCRPRVLSARGAAAFTPDIVCHAFERNVIAHPAAAGLGGALVPAWPGSVLPFSRVRCTGNPTAGSRPASEAAPTPARRWRQRRRNCGTRPPRPRRPHRGTSAP
ncbi:LysR substrate-binding domain-containing protein [Streptomyces sp. NPDC057052]|uniref:LysR substrate-binding domain-containing protein n=1 Tax=Streptomyces sp. NPDC057052 TaxID=3346010 RepID=UPI003633B070